MNHDLTQGSITKKLLMFAFPLMVGNLLQQFYNIADTLIVARYLGADALAAVGSSYTLMVFLTSIILGLCMGCSAYFSILYGRKQMEQLKNSFFLSFLIIGIGTVVLNVLVYAALPLTLDLLQVPSSVYPFMNEYLLWIYAGIIATFLYNYFSNLLRSVGNSMIPLIFLAVSAIINIILDLWFVVGLSWGVKGAAIATVTAQYISGIGIMLYYFLCFPQLRVHKQHMYWDMNVIKQIFSFSFLTCLQQSVMNLGILAVQGLVNSFGTVIMAAFAAAVKIDSFAYMPVQDFGNAFSTFIAQNYGAGKTERMKKGIKSAVVCVFSFCIIISLFVCIFAKEFMGIFIDASQLDIILAGAGYLRIEAAFYFGIGLLFLFYGYYRAISRPEMSVVLTVISLGTRVLLAYTLSSIPSIGVYGIWMSVPIGWILADLTGAFVYFHDQRKLKV